MGKIMNTTHRPLKFCSRCMGYGKMLRRMKVFNSFGNVLGESRLSNTTDYCTKLTIVYHGTFEKL